MSPYKDLRSFATLRRIIARLRGPRGCPWDRKQTSLSLKTSFLEECYEVLQAIDGQQPGELRDELGDLLLHIVLQAQIASEEGRFSIEDVIERIGTKLIHRHPHVFAGVKVKDVEEIVANWEVLKREERSEGGSLLAGVPSQLPALAYSESLQRRVAAVGFDWPDMSGVLDKLGEEIKELKEAPDEKEREKEFGDLLFTLVNIARRSDIDSEAALREANRRFYRRFQYMEELSRERGLDFAALDLEEKDRLWEEAKARLEA